LDERLDVLGTRVDAYYACPHLPDAQEARRPEYVVDCDCRKPRPGLLLRAAADMAIDLADSWMIGDSWRDVAAGHAAGVRTVRLAADPEHDQPRPPDVPPPTAEVADLAQAAEFILTFPERTSESAATPQDAAPPAPDAAPPGPDASPPGPDPATAAGDAARPAPDAAPPAPTEAAAAPEPEAAPAPPATSAPAPPPAGAAGAVHGSAGAALAAAMPALSALPPASAAAALGAADARSCARCGGPVAPADLASGAAGEPDGLVLCTECLARRPRDGADRLPDTPVDLLKSILLELRRLGRPPAAANLTFYRLLAYLAMAGAVFCGLVLGLLGEDRATFLQVAILLQLVSLALLWFERRP